MPKKLLPPEAAPEQELALFALRRTIFPQPSWTWRITKPPSQHPLLTSAPAHISSLHLHLSHAPSYKQQLRPRYKQMQRSPHTSTNLTHHLAFGFQKRRLVGATSHRSCFQKHRRSKSPIALLLLSERNILGSTSLIPLLLPIQSQRRSSIRHHPLGPAVKGSRVSNALLLIPRGESVQVAEPNHVASVCFRMQTISLTFHIPVLVIFHNVRFSLDWI